MERERAQEDVEVCLSTRRAQRTSRRCVTLPSQASLIPGRIQTTLPPTERALYAALAPTASTSVVLKAASRTWEDHLWALVSGACEERLSRGLASIARECFWEGGLGALESGNADEEGVEGSVGVEDEEAWEDEVIQTLQELAGVQVSEG